MEYPIILSKQQQASISLIKSDLRFIYTVLRNRDAIESNYWAMLFPFIGVIIDGTEDWLKAYNNSHKVKFEVPLFSAEEQQFYETLRLSIKMWDKSYSEIREMLAQKYIESDLYFSSLCKPISKRLRLYDIYGADIVNGNYCGNTILCNCYIPHYQLGETDGEQIRKLSIIGGEYISIFRATEEYKTDYTLNFSAIDCGGFIKSPVGNRFSDKFVLFSLLCQTNFVLICVDKFILEECPVKLRFAYLQYYYVSHILEEINHNSGTMFIVNDKYVSDKFRNAMAHYKIGVALKQDEIIENDRFFGLTQKYFNCDYMTLKTNITSELASLSRQISRFLNFT